MFQIKIDNELTESVERLLKEHNFGNRSVADGSY